MGRLVSVIDYGVGNLLSVKRAFEYCGADVKLVSSGEEILKAETLVLPGVGAFKNAMNELIKLDIEDAIIEFSTSGKPMMGICLGMQMLLDESEEFGITKGLGIIPGKVERIEDITVTGEYQKIPQVGWNSLHIPKFLNNELWEDTILNGIKEGKSVYFVHSYAAKPINVDNRLADTYYGGKSISAVVKKDNVYGCQFHPEKSGEIGLKIIKNFLNI